MIAQPYKSTVLADNSRNRNVIPYALSIAAAVSLLLTYLFSSFNVLAVLSLWPLTFGFVLIGSALFSHHIWKQAAWGVAIVGQLLGMVGIALLLFASL